jgi:hypothetical protein
MPRRKETRCSRLLTFKKNEAEPGYSLSEQKPGFPRRGLNGSVLIFPRAVRPISCSVGARKIFRFNDNILALQIAEFRELWACPPSPDSYSTVDHCSKQPTPSRSRINLDHPVVQSAKRGERRRLICPSGCLSMGLSSLISDFPKNISVPTHPKSILELSLSRPTEGRIAIVRDAGWDAVDAAALGAQRGCRAGWRKARERSNGELTNDVAAYGEVVWS